MPGTPDAPGTPVATAGVGEISVACTAPADNGAAITDYEYSLDGGATWASGKTASCPVKITGLTGGKAYSVKVRAVNEYGPGPASDAVAGTPGSAPATPGASQAAAETDPTMAMPGAAVTGGSMLRATVDPSVGGRVTVTVTLGGRKVGRAIRTATKAGRMTVPVALSPAAQAVLRAAGGAFSHADGRPLSYNDGDIRQAGCLIASHGPAHRELCERAAAAMAHFAARFRSRRSR